MDTPCISNENMKLNLVLIDGITSGKKLLFNWYSVLIKIPDNILVTDERKKLMVYLRQSTIFSNKLR